MSDFQKIRLGDYIETLTDYHANGSYEILEKNITLKSNPDFAVMIRTLNFEKSNFKDKLIYLNETEYNYLSKTKVYPNDILMNKIANPGTIYLMPDLEKPVSLAMNLFLIRFNSKLNQQFMFYLMKNNEKYIKRFSGGTTTSTIRKDTVRDLEFMVPSKKKQDSIVVFFNALSSKIELINKITEKLEAMTKLIYEYWFVQFDFPDENGKPYKSSGGKMVFNEDLKMEIPYGWEVIELGDLVSFQKGISYSSKDIGLTGTPMINLDSFYLDGRYKEEGIKYFNGKVNPDKLCKKGDLALAVTDVTRNADIIGKGFSVPDLFDGDFLISTDVAKVELSDRLTKDFILKLFNSDNYHNYIKYFASGTLVLHLDLNGIRWSKIALPPLELQKRYSEINQSAQLKFTNSMKENQSLSKLRDWLLPLLMNGQVTVSGAI